MKITFMNGTESGRVCEFVLPEITVGREDANVLRLPTDGVSRYHARFRQDLLRGGWCVVDQGSTNGVKVNGVRISGEQMLCENDTVEIGEQMLMVSDLSGEPPKIVFNPVIPETPGVTTGPAPGTAVSNTMAPVAEVPQSKETSAAAKGEELLRALRDKSLFSKEEKTAPEAVSADPEKKNGNPRSILLYTVIGCALLVAVVSAISAFSAGKPAEKSAALQQEYPIYLSFEKLAIQRDNVFRFSLQLEHNRAVFCIDDIQSRRHPEPLVVTNPPGLNVLRGRLTNSGIWKTASNAGGEDGSGVRRRLALMLGPQSVECVINGQRVPDDFEEVEQAILEFAEGCGMQTISLSGAEIMEYAKRNFDKAEDLFANRESGGSYLRDSIARYRVVVNYLGQFSPPPQIWKIARKRLTEAENLQKQKLSDLEYRRVSLQAARDFEALRQVFKETMELTEPESPEYNQARKRLHILDVRLKKGRGGR